MEIGQSPHSIWTGSRTCPLMYLFSPEDTMARCWKKRAAPLCRKYLCACLTLLLLPTATWSIINCLHKWLYTIVSQGQLFTYYETQTLQLWINPLSFQKASFGNHSPAILPPYHCSLWMTPLSFKGASHFAVVILRQLFKKSPTQGSAIFSLLKGGCFRDLSGLACMVMAGSLSLDR